VTPSIRPARPSDLAALTALYNHYVEAGPVTFDTRRFAPEERARWLARFDGARYRLLVAEHEGTLAGYAGSMPFREKPAYETSVETTIYLAPGCAGAGFGTRLYRALFAALEGEDLHRAYAGITLPNETSVRLHERFGFRLVGVYREVGRKQGRYWDVAWYERPL
jgi:phosphinothricin acetyltransferase